MSTNKTERFAKENWDPTPGRIAALTNSEVMQNDLLNLSCNLTLLSKLAVEKVEDEDESIIDVCFAIKSVADSLAKMPERMDPTLRFLKKCNESGELDRHNADTAGDDGKIEPSSSFCEHCAHRKTCSVHLYLPKRSGKNCGGFEKAGGTFKK